MSPKAVHTVPADSLVLPNWYEDHEPKSWTPPSDHKFSWLSNGYHQRNNAGDRADVSAVFPVSAAHTHSRTLPLSHFSVLRYSLCIHNPSKPEKRNSKYRLHGSIFSPLCSAWSKSVLSSQPSAARSKRES